MANRYWVGGTGTFDTSSTTHWSATSGGASGASAPGANDDVFIDGASGGGTITTGANLDIKSIDFTGFAGTFAGSNNIQCRGNFKFSTGMTQSWTGNLTSNVNPMLLTSNGKSFLGGISMSSDITLQDALVFASTAALTLSSGIFDANNFNVTGGAVLIPSGSPTLNMGSGTWTLNGDNATAGGGSGVFYNNASSSTINAGTSLIKFTNTSNNAVWFRPQNKTYYNVWFSRGSSTGDIAFFADGGTFNDIKDNGTGTHNLFFEDGQTYTAVSWHVSGTAGHLISVWARQSISNFFLSIPSGIVSSDYLNLKRSTAQGGADFYAGVNSVNTASNGGWQFTVPPIIVETDAVSTIKTTSATGNGEVVYPGPDAITERGFVWSLSPNPTISDSKVTVAGTSGAYSGAITGLVKNTLYYVRAYATTALGTTYGDQVTFTTRETVVITNPVTDIQRTTPLGHGNVADDGGETITERGIAWATHSDPTISDNKVIVAGTTGEFEGPITGLADDTIYYVRAYAITAVATTYGDNFSFLSKSSLGRVGALDTGFLDFDEPIYFEFIDRWRAYTDMYAKSKAISGLNLYTENAADSRVYFQSQKAPPNAWEDMGTIDEKNNSLFPNASTDDFEVGRIRIAGFSSGDPIVIHGVEILSLNVKGFDSN